MKSTALATVTTILLLAGPALAAQPTKKPAPKPAGAPAADDKGAPPKPDLPTGPADQSAFMGDIDSSPEWFHKTDEAIAELTDLIKSLPDSDSKATRMIQLAELYWEKSEHLHLKAVKSLNKRYDAWFANHGKAEDEPKIDQEPDEKNSDAVMQKAVTIYEFVIKKYPHNQRGDQAHYYLGNAYLQLLKKDQAVATFQKLIDNYPQSDYIPDAYLALGEFYFDNAKTNKDFLPKAKDAYEQVLKYKNSKSWGYALYKLGWVFKNQKECEKAIGAFQGVIKFSIEQESQGHSLEYKEQALNDLVASYTDCGQVDTAVAYLQQFGPTYVRKVLELFGAQYFEQGRDDESIAVYKKLVDLEPMNGKNLTYEGEILKAYIRKNDRPQILGQLDHVVKMLQPDSPWVQANQDKKDQIADQRDAMEHSVATYAKEVYEESKKLSTDQSFNGFKQAEQFFNYYLQTFPTGKNTYSLRMALAETQYKLAEHPGAGNDNNYRLTKYKQALDTYLKEVEADPKGSFVSLASEDAIFAADKILKLTDDNHLRKDPHPAKDDFTQKDLPGEEQLVVKSCDSYVKYNPKGPKIVPTRYKAAYIYYQFNQFDEAIKRFNDVIAMAPGSDQARFAADLILDTYGTIKKDPKTANEYARNFLKMPALASQKNPDDNGQPYSHELEDKVQRTQFTLAQQLVTQGKHADAAVAFIEFAKEFPSSQFVADSYYNASVEEVAAGQVDEAIKTREDFIHRFPDNPHTPEVIYFLGENYQKTIAFDKAADYFEMLATKYKDSKNSADALYNAALFRENLGELQKAVADYRQYMKQYPDRPDTCDVLWTIADVYEKKGKDNANASKTFDEYMKTCGSKGKGNPDLYLDAKVRKAKMVYDSGKKKDAYPMFADVVQSYNELAHQKAKIGPTGLGAAAQSAFYLVEPKFEEYEDYKLNDVKKLKTQIPTKLKMIKPLVAEYTKVVEYKHGDWAVASLYQAGRLAEDFITALKDAPIPPEVKTDTQKELYETDMEEQMGPVEDAAIDLYKKCVDTSAQYRIYNEYTQKALAGLERIRPSQYNARDPEIRVPPSTDTLAFESSPIIEVK